MNNSMFMSDHYTETLNKSKNVSTNILKELTKQLLYMADCKYTYWPHINFKLIDTVHIFTSLFHLNIKLLLIYFSGTFFFRYTLKMQNII